MIPKASFLGCLLAAFLFAESRSQSYDIYVSPTGRDAAEGSMQAPVQSLEKAAAMARTKAGKVAVNIHLAGGSYALTSPLRLGPEDGGTAEAPVHWKAMPGESPVISGGVMVGPWNKERDGTWSASLPEQIEGRFRSLYVNGKRATRARHPNQGFLRIVKAGEDKRTHFFFRNKDVPELISLEGLELVLLHDWSITRTPVRSIDRAGRRLEAIDSIGSRLNFFTLTHWEEQPRYYLENAREFLDHPGEWYADFQERTLYYQPLPGEQIADLQAVIPKTEKLLILQGSGQEPVEHISFSGLSFRHSAWTLPGKGYFGIQACMFTDRSQAPGPWAVVPAAIELDLANRIRFGQCTVRNTGGSGLWIRKNCHECEISTCHFLDISGNGICIGEGQNRMVDGQPWWQAAPEEVSTGNRISHTLVESCGRQFYGAVGIWCGLVANTTIEHNEVRNLPYTGISVGWMWTPEPTPCKENILHSNHIHHILNTLSDGGGIYSLGLQPGSRITRNLIHDVKLNAGRAESNGMFLDEGTKEPLVEGNIIYNIAKSPLRFHKAHHPTMVRDNVLMCGNRIPPIAYNRTMEEDIIKEGNVILQQSSESDRHRLQVLIDALRPD